MNSTNNKKLSTSVGTTLIVLSSFFYASYGIWTKLMGNFFDGYTASAIRGMLVVLILLSVALYSQKFEPLNLKKNWPYILGMFIASLFTWGPLYYSILEAGVGISLAVNYINIVLGMLIFGGMFAGERFTREKAISTVLGIVGLALIFSPTSESFAWIPLSGAALSGLASSAGAVFAKKIPYNSTQSTIAWWSTSVVANMFMAFLLQKTYPTFNWQIEWFYLLLFAVASLIASWSLIKGMEFIDAGVAGILGLLEIVFGVLFGMILFSERPSIPALVGIAVVIIAVAIPYIRELGTPRKNTISS